MGDPKRNSVATGRWWPLCRCFSIYILGVMTTCAPRADSRARIIFCMWGLLHILDYLLCDVLHVSSDLSHRCCIKSCMWLSWNKHFSQMLFWGSEQSLGLLLFGYKRGVYVCFLVCFSIYYILIYCVYVNVYGYAYVGACGCHGMHVSPGDLTQIFGFGSWAISLALFALLFHFWRQGLTM